MFHLYSRMTQTVTRPSPAREVNTMFYITTLLFTITATISTQALLVHANLPPGLAGDAWGQEYCKQGLCAIMTSDRWHWCCEHYRRCCAYVEYVRPHDPFYFEKPEEVVNKFSSRSQKPEASSQEPPASPQEQPPASAEEFSTEVDQPSRSSRLQEDPLMVLEEQPRSQPQPPSYSQTKPSPDPAQTQPRPQDQPPRSYNDVLRRGDEKMCRAKFCGLLSQRKHRRCCDLYRQCCAYADLRKVNDPFFYEKHPMYV
ncbi:uncharacterized protein [Panulirus ornatus]|uniref:uncharacterized protein isoform X2 n=1 Tax=Panulirus ornatus TaxID=150431 RepID=UPI003A8C5A74